MGIRTSGKSKDLRSKKAGGTDLTKQSEVNTSKGIFTALLISILFWVVTIGFVFLLSYDSGNNNISREESTIRGDRPVQSSLTSENFRRKTHESFKN
ncbi:MAG TPA: hypothetical protein VLB01_03175 [Thermodesulfobacteriota bacterium]|nr:hypothetical protein [Thermodesulfobacteriota bacterium]